MVLIVRFPRLGGHPDRILRDSPTYRDTEGDSPFMPINPGNSVLVLKCFTAVEMLYLNARPEFARAVSEIIALNDLDKVVELGQHLLDLQDEPIREALILRPSSRPSPNLQRTVKVMHVEGIVAVSKVARGLPNREPAWPPRVQP